MQDPFSGIPSEAILNILSYFNLQELAKIASVQKNWNQFVVKAIKNEILREIHALKAQANPFKKKISDMYGEYISKPEQYYTIFRDYINKALKIGYLPLIWGVLKESLVEVGDEFYSDFRSVFLGLIKTNKEYEEFTSEESTSLDYILNLKNADLTYCTLENKDLTNIDLSTVILKGARLINAKFSPQQLLSAKSILFMVINEETLKNNHFSQEDIEKLQKKHVDEITQFIDSTDINNANAIMTLAENFLAQTNNANGVPFLFMRQFNGNKILNAARKILAYLLSVNVEKRHKMVSENAGVHYVLNTVVNIYHEKRSTPLDENEKNELFLITKILNMEYGYLELSGLTLTGVDLKDVDLTDANLTGATVNINDLLSTSSICNIKIDKDTFKKNNYTDDDIIQLKRKQIGDYKNHFESCTDLWGLCKELNELLLNPSHLLKFKRTGVFNYGDTEAFAIVINYGRNRILDLVNSYITNKNNLDQNTTLALNKLRNSDYDLLNKIFNTNIYGFNLWNSNQSADNSKEVLNAIKDKISIILGDEIKQNQDIQLRYQVCARYAPQ